VKQTRNLWASIALVAVLVAASLVGFATGYLKPKLGLDLQGGVSVILQAPDSTPKDVMNQALDNIRNRVDAFGVGEPQIAVTGTTIDVQIPGGANGTIQEQQKTQYCLVSTNGTNYGCAPDQATAQKALGDLQVTPQPAEVCVEDPAGTQLQCFPDQPQADTYKSSLSVAKKSPASPTPSASPSASPSPPLKGDWCLADSTGTDVACYPTKKAANAAQKGLSTTVTKNTYCVTDASGSDVSGASPTPSASPSASPTASPSASASPSPTPKPSTFSKLSFDGASTPPCGLKTQDDAASQLAAIKVSQQNTQYCVISSAQENLGCYISRAAAENRQRSTGQDHLISIIGKTARLEQRPVLAVLPATDTTPVTCADPNQQDTPACSFDALKGKEVVYLDSHGQKLKLGPVVLSGDQITNATPGVDQQTSGWVVNFTLNDEGKASFAAATTAALTKPPPQNQIAIVVDRQVISSPQVTGAITGGSGQIQGVSEQEAKDLSTQLNAGALPVDLKIQSVQTISPTLGSESLHQGIVAGLVGLVLLFAYLLFYYRLLGIVAWVGMTIWAILALALISLAGRLVGYSLTLAGVAGLVISLGVTADSYIVFFERLKDEVRGGKSPRSAVHPAFKRAYRTIVAADVVTLIAAVVLYVTAVSSVRGFALTLGVATLLDLFVVWFFKRPTVFLIARNDRLVNMHGFGLSSGVAAEPEPGEAVPVGAGGGGS
jgi:preprotein translocase subunit SecD